MNSETLSSRIIKEAMISNPDASRSEILEGILAIIQRDVLPAVLKDLSLPKFPSWADIVIESRRPKLPRKEAKREGFLEERRRVIQEVTYLRQKLHWDGDRTSAVYPYLEDSDNLATLPGLGGSSFERAPKYDGEKAKAPAGEEFGKAYPHIFPSLKPKHQITFSERLQERITSIPLLEKVFSKIEIDLRDLIASRKIEANLVVSLQLDFEITSWEKTLITIKELPPALTFEDRMKIWETFDLTIRSRINALRKEADENTNEYLENLNRNLFVHIEL